MVLEDMFVCALAIPQINYNASLSHQNEFIYFTIGETQSLNVAEVCHGSQCMKLLSKGHFVSKLTQVQCFKGKNRRQ